MKKLGALFSTPLRGWLRAMQSAGKIKPGGKLMFINSNTGMAVPAAADAPSATDLMREGAGQEPSMSPDPDQMLREAGRA